MKIDFSERHEGRENCANHAAQNMLEDVRAMWGNEALLWGFCRHIKKTKRLLNSSEFDHMIYDKDALIEVRVQEIEAQRYDIPRFRMTYEAGYTNFGIVSYCLVTRFKYHGFDYVHRAVCVDESNTVAEVLKDIARRVSWEAEAAHDVLEQHRASLEAEKKKCCETTKKKR